MVVLWINVELNIFRIRDGEAENTTAHHTSATNRFAVHVQCEIDTSTAGVTNHELCFDLSILPCLNRNQPDFSPSA